MNDDDQEKRKQQLKKTSNRELKKILQQRNVSYTDCLEKADFIARIISTDDIDEKKEQSSSSKERTIAGSKCIVLENSQSSYDVAVIMCHGYGANEKDLASIGDDLLKSPKLKTKNVRFIFPRAPIELDTGGFAWWPLDFQALLMKGLTQGLDKVFTGPAPKGADGALKLMIDLIEETKKQTDLPESRIIIGGFSQGAWLMTDAMFSLKESIGTLLVLSGALFRHEKWDKIADEHKGTKVIQTHGKSDMMLPLQIGTALKDFFISKGMDVDFTAFDGAHSIPEEGIKKLHNSILTVSETEK